MVDDLLATWTDPAITLFVRVPIRLLGIHHGDGLLCNDANFVNILFFLEVDAITAKEVWAGLHDFIHESRHNTFTKAFITFYRI